MTQKEIIKKFLQHENKWIPSYQLRSTQTPFGWLGFQADRRCRELAEAGEIEHKISGKYAYYRAKQKEIITRFSPRLSQTNQLSLIKDGIFY